MSRSFTQKIWDYAFLPRWSRRRLLCSKLDEYFPTLRNVRNNHATKRLKGANRQPISHSAASPKHPPYLTAIPHPTVGIGHTLAEYNAGRVFAKKLGLAYAHCPLGEPWESLLHFYSDSVGIPDLLKRGYRWIHLPRLDRNLDPKELDQCRTFIAKKSAQAPTLFRLDYGQSAYDHSATQSELRRVYHQGLYKLRQGSDPKSIADARLDIRPLQRPAFYSASVHEQTPRHPSSRLSLQLRDLRESDAINVVLHIRSANQADCMVRAKLNAPDATERYPDIKYFLKIAQNILDENKGERLKFLVFGQGAFERFVPLQALGDVAFHIDSDLYEAFYNMTLADILVTSPSSFSFKAAMLCQGRKYAPDGWWHKIPDSEDWNNSIS